MQITKTSQLSGKQRTKDIDVTIDQIKEWGAGNLIQNVMPHLNKWDREFLMTGNTKEDWEKAFGPDTDEEE